MTLRRSCPMGTALLLLLCCSPALQADAPPRAAATTDASALESHQRQRLEHFASLVDKAVATGDFVGLAVAVVSKGEVKLLRTYGVREAGGSEPVTPDTVFRVASLSKGFAAALAALAIQDRKLSMATPVANFAPRFALSGGAHSILTIDHILSHRVGLPPNAYDNLLEAGIPVDDILGRFQGVKPICKVGACYTYQNITFNLIGNVLESVYGKPYEALVRERLFEPLGMRTASLGYEGLTAFGNWARPHTRKRLPGVEEHYTPWRIVDIRDAYYRTPAAGGVNASITDMARWLAAQMGGAPQVLPPKVLSEIHTPVIATPAETRRQRSLKARIARTEYGRGWRIYDYAGETLINHSGGVEGYGAQIAWLPERDIGLVVLSNSRSRRLFRILPAFLDIELGLTGEDWLELEKATS